MSVHVTGALEPRVLLPAPPSPILPLFFTTLLKNGFREEFTFLSDLQIWKTLLEEKGLPVQMALVGRGAFDLAEDQPVSFLECAIALSKETDCLLEYAHAYLNTIGNATEILRHRFLKTYMTVHESDRHFVRMAFECTTQEGQTVTLTWTLGQHPRLFLPLSEAPYLPLQNAFLNPPQPLEITSRFPLEECRRQRRDHLLQILHPEELSGYDVATLYLRLSQGGEKWVHSPGLVATLVSKLTEQSLHFFLHSLDTNSAGYLTLLLLLEPHLPVLTEQLKRALQQTCQIEGGDLWPSFHLWILSSLSQFKIVIEGDRASIESSYFQYEVGMEALMTRFPEPPRKRSPSSILDAFFTWGLQQHHVPTITFAWNPQIWPLEVTAFDLSLWRTCTQLPQGAERCLERLHSLIPPLSADLQAFKEELLLQLLESQNYTIAATHLNRESSSALIQGRIIQALRDHFSEAKGLAPFAHLDETGILELLVPASTWPQAMERLQLLRVRLTDTILHALPSPSRSLTATQKVALTVLLSQSQTQLSPFALAQYATRHHLSLSQEQKNQLLSSTDQGSPQEIDQLFLTHGLPCPPALLVRLIHTEAWDLAIARYRENPSLIQGTGLEESLARQLLEKEDYPEVHVLLKDISLSEETQNRLLQHLSTQFSRAKVLIPCMALTEPTVLKLLPDHLAYQDMIARLDSMEVPLTDTMVLKLPPYNLRTPFRQKKALQNLLHRSSETLSSLLLAELAERHGCSLPEGHQEKLRLCDDQGNPQQIHQLFKHFNIMPSPQLIVRLIEAHYFDFALFWCSKMATPEDYLPLFMQQGFVDCVSLLTKQTPEEKWLEWAQQCVKQEKTSLPLTVLDRAPQAFIDFVFTRLPNEVGLFTALNQHYIPSPPVLESFLVGVLNRGESFPLLIRYFLKNNTFPKHLKSFFLQKAIPYVIQHQKGELKPWMEHCVHLEDPVLKEECILSLLLTNPSLWTLEEWTQYAERYLSPLSTSTHRFKQVAISLYLTSHNSTYIQTVLDWVQEDISLLLSLLHSRVLPSLAIEWLLQTPLSLEQCVSLSSHTPSFAKKAVLIAAKTEQLCTPALIKKALPWLRSQEEFALVSLLSSQKGPLIEQALQQEDLQVIVFGLTLAESHSYKSPQVNQTLITLLTVHHNWVLFMEWKKRLAIPPTIWIQILSLPLTKSLQREVLEAVYHRLTFLIQEPKLELRLIEELFDLFVFAPVWPTEETEHPLHIHRGRYLFKQLRKRHCFLAYPDENTTDRLLVPPELLMRWQGRLYLNFTPPPVITTAHLESLKNLPPEERSDLKIVLDRLHGQSYTSRISDQEQTKILLYILQRVLKTPSTEAAWYASALLDKLQRGCCLNRDLVVCYKLLTDQLPSFALQGSIVTMSDRNIKTSFYDYLSNLFFQTLLPPKELQGGLIYKAWEGDLGLEVFTAYYDRMIESFQKSTSPQRAILLNHLFEALGLSTQFPLLPQDRGKTFYQLFNKLISLYPLSEFLKEDLASTSTEEASPLLNIASDPVLHILTKLKNPEIRQGIFAEFVTHWIERLIEEQFLAHARNVFQHPTSRAIFSFPAHQQFVTRCCRALKLSSSDLSPFLKGGI